MWRGFVRSYDEARGQIIGRMLVVLTLQKEYTYPGTTGLGERSCLVSADS